ncbi:dUTP diphosphatase [Aedoeadaptatus pacaensis]|uniref:dUTP diphosphatase n=1 Tax=Aedoeadaptatus pacaensis TaxID=1776390 RepID=UPI000838E49F|nr:dUTP diphosphatase [Peptoniphilus pacaensis]
MNVKVVNKSRHPLPSYKTEGSCGMDLRANLEESKILKPLERAMIPTGLFFEIPKGIEGQVRARSGLSLKKGITLINGIGTIDSDYRGELGILVVNLSDEEVTIEDGDRIAQMVFMAYEVAHWVQVESLDELSETERGEGGFGHTGIR